VADFGDARGQHLLVRQAALEHALAERLVLDAGDTFQLGDILQLCVRKNAQQRLGVHHAVEGLQLARLDLALQHPARNPGQTRRARKRQELWHVPLTPDS
jgi:hypothetical protein